MKKFLFLLLAALFTFAAAPIKAAPVRPIVKGIRTVPASVARFRGITPLAKYKPLTFLTGRIQWVPASALKTNNLTLPKASSRTGRVTQQVQDQRLVNLATLQLTPPEEMELLQNIFEHQRTDLSFSDPYLTTAPYFWVERGLAITPAHRARALANYRTRLQGLEDYSADIVKIKKTEVPVNRWAHNMAVAANLGFFGEEADALLILETYQKAPANLRAYTEVITGRALLSLGADGALEKLASLSAKEGELSGQFWAGVKSARPDLDLPAVREGSKVPAMPAELQELLETYNPLNKIHADVTQEGTEAWLALKENVEKAAPPPAANRPTGPPTEQTSAASTPGPHSAAPQTPEASEPNPSTVSIPQEAPSAATAPAVETPVSSFTPSVNFASGLFNANNSSGVINTFFASRNIAISDNFQAIQLLRTKRDEFILALQTDDELLKLAIKGLDNERLSTLRQHFPPAPHSSDVISRECAQKIADTILKLADPAFAQEILQLTGNSGYIFLDYDNKTNIYLATETSLNPNNFLDGVNGRHISRADILSTFSPGIAKTAQTPRDPDTTILPDRIFTFKDASGNPVKKTFGELAEFITNNPHATFTGIKYQRTRQIETMGRPFQTPIKLYQEELADPELKALDELLRSQTPPALILLTGVTAPDQLRNLYSLLQNVQPGLTKYFQTKIPGLRAADLTFTTRMGEHEINNGFYRIHLSNMHLHMQVYIPQKEFGVTFTLPIRASLAEKEAILQEFEHWIQAGQPGVSFIENYSRQPENVIPPASTRRQEIPDDAPAADYPEMYPDGLIPAFAF